MREKAREGGFPESRESNREFADFPAVSALHDANSRPHSNTLRKIPVRVLHRALPDLQRMKLCYSAARVVGTEVGIPLVRLSPSKSWTRGPWSTSDCRHGPSSAPEHAS